MSCLANIWTHLQKRLGIYVYTCPYCDFRTNMDWVAESHKIFHTIQEEESYQLVSV